MPSFPPLRGTRPRCADAPPLRADDGTQNALLSSERFGSSVERDDGRHPLWRVLRSVAGRCWVVGAWELAVERCAGLVGAWTGGLSFGSYCVQQGRHDHLRRMSSLSGRVTSRLRVAAAPRPWPADPTVGSTVEACHAAPAWPCPPAWWVGRSPATRPRAVTPGGPPEDTPARGDQHPARIGDRQGPQMHLLAEAQRSPTVHPTDLRLALPGVPHPRPAVLQPWRPAVSGPRQRAAGGGASPAVAGQGDDEGRHRPTSSGP